MFEALPENIRNLCAPAFALFLRDPSHRSLRLHELADTKKGRHRNGSVSVSINMQYRAIFARDGNVNVWYWIGTHADYNTFIGDAK